MPTEVCEHVFSLKDVEGRGLPQKSNEAPLNVPHQRLLLPLGQTLLPISCLERGRARASCVS